VSRQRGSTLFELLTLLAIAGIIVAIAVPSVTSARHTLVADAASRELALVLRAAQARAQARVGIVRVSVRGDGSYSVGDVDAHELDPVASGALGAPVISNYPAGTLEFGPRGLPSLPGVASPRAGSFSVGIGGNAVVVVQLYGCVRCA
jgi:Tfp pilus assembly protein FimT